MEVGEVSYGRRAETRETSGYRVSFAERPCAFIVAAAFACTAVAHAGPISTSWPMTGSNDCSSVAAAAVSGWYAVADTLDDQVELRDSGTNMVRTIGPTDFTTVCPWMTFDTSIDGPVAITFSDSGRLLFIAVRDSSTASDGLPSQAILRFDTQTGELRLFRRLTLPQPTSSHSRVALAHFKGRLYVSTPGLLEIYQSGANDLSGSLLSTNTFVTAGSQSCGVTIDRTESQIYAATDGTLYRATLGSTTLAFSAVGSIVPGIQSLAWSDHYGGVLNPGLYIAAAQGTGATFTQLFHLTPNQARTTFTTASAYMTGSESFKSLAATADGKLLACADDHAWLLSDSTDTRLSLSAWMPDEFQQVVRFGRGLITPCSTCCQNTPECGTSCTPAGWVIDGDVQLGWTRFHPATPDAAAWVVLLLMMNDHLYGDPTAKPTVRLILERYAGRSADGIMPSRTADGIYRHWINPCNGGQFGSWSDEHATLSTMKIVLAAARASAFYSDDASIQASTRAIICGVRNWSSYFRPGDFGLYFKGLPAGGPDTDGPAGLAFQEGIIFAEQASVFDGGLADSAYAWWLNRAVQPACITLFGRPISTDSWGTCRAAFNSLYPLLTVSDFRSNPAWRDQILSLRMSNAAWTDDNGPKYNTVFSAGTNPSGYHADSLTHHPFNITTFTSLLGFCAGTGGVEGSKAEAVAAYHAYRMGARQTFLGGASILYRRSDTDRAYQPNSAGLPDVALGALGLAELILPGSIAAVLTGPYPSCGPCIADVDDGTGSGTPDGGVTIEDLLHYLSIFDDGLLAADVDDGTGTGTRDGGVTIDDLLYYLVRFDAGC